MNNALIIGSGPAGSSSARVLADAGWSVRVFEKRPHIAGNCYDEYDKKGILVHRYGPHFFRTNSLSLITWLSAYTSWIPGRYYVRAKVGNKLIPMPISLSTMTALKKNVFTKEDFEEYLERERVHILDPKNAQEQCLALFGRELYETLFRGYTIKQWGAEPGELDPSITARIPLRFNWDERYVSEDYQVMPADGYYQMFRRMLDHDNIIVKTNCYFEPSAVMKMKNDFNCIIYTGKIDEFFQFRYGKLGYRSLSFEWKYFKDNYIQPCVTINYPGDFDYTRTVEIKHVTGQDCEGTTICYEYPRSQGEPFYPVLNKENQDKYTKYKALADKQEPKIFFLGRLAEYKYFNMDHTFERSIALANQIWQNRR